MDSYELETHPFRDFVWPDTKTLIVGTFPTHKKNRDFEFFYGSKTNHFWKIMESVFNVQFIKRGSQDIVRERELFLKNNKIGITDMLQVCYRRNRQSSDEYLYPVKIKDLSSFIKDHNSIKTVVLTSRTACVGALGLLKTHLEIQDLKMENLDGVLHGLIQIANEEIEVIVPYSPSDRSVKEHSIEKVTEMWKYAFGKSKK